MDTLEAAIAEFSTILERSSVELARLADAPRADGRWSRKQILGHLIDSAANNHQRFVRGQHQRDLPTPAYAQEQWVETERFEDREWTDLVQFWIAYNRHLLHLMKHVSPEYLGSIIRIGNFEPATLEFVMVDYVSHLKHHLRQIGLAIE
jgi:hypothetical protein